MTSPDYRYTVSSASLQSTFATRPEPLGFGGRATSSAVAGPPDTHAQRRSAGRHQSRQRMALVIVKEMSQ